MTEEKNKREKNDDPNVSVTSEEKKKKNEFLASDTAVWKKILKISWPLVLLSLTNASYLLIDAILASTLVDSYSAPAVLGIIMPMIMIGSAFSLMAIVGVSLTISKRIGQEKYSEAENIFGQGILLSFTYGFLIFISIFIIMPFWTNFMYSLNDSHLDDQAIHDGIAYARITGAAFIFMIFRDVIARTLRTEGRSLSSAIIPIVAVPINLLFDWIFMGPVGMGVQGAAYATLIGTFTGAVMAFGYGIFLRKYKNTRINFELKNMKPDPYYIQDVFKFGAGPFFRRIGQISFSVVATIYVVQLLPPIAGEKDYWKQFLTASSRSIAFVSITGLAFTQGAAIIIAYYYGKKDYAKMKESIFYLAIFVISANIIAAAILISIGNQILTAFGITSQSNAYRNALYITAATIPIYGISGVFVTFYTSTGNVKQLFIMSIFGNALIGVSMVFIFYYLIYLNTYSPGLFFMGYAVNPILQVEIFFWIFYYNLKHLETKK